MGGTADLSVDELLSQLAKKGKKVKVLDGEEGPDQQAGGDIEEDIDELLDQPDNAGPKSGQGVQKVTRRKKKTDGTQ